MVWLLFNSPIRMDTDEMEFFESARNNRIAMAMVYIHVNASHVKSWFIR